MNIFTQIFVSVSLMVLAVSSVQTTMGIHSQDLQEAYDCGFEDGMAEVLEHVNIEKHEAGCDCDSCVDSGLYTGFETSDNPFK